LFCFLLLKGSLNKKLNLSLARLTLLIKPKIPLLIKLKIPQT